jgi:outer membrane protein assembly factor BamB
MAAGAAALAKPVELRTPPSRTTFRDGIDVRYRPWFVHFHRQWVGWLALGAVALGLERGHGADGQWPQFRGPGGSGVGATDFPTHFGPNSNVLWKVVLPSGHSSPCIWGGRIFLTGFTDGKLETTCLSRGDGRLLWRRHVEPGSIERGAQLSHPSTASPTTDGERVCVYFGAFGLVSYDFDGKELWRKPLSVPVTQHGAGTSPVLAGDLLILNCDQDVGSYLLAVNKRDGGTAWRTDRPGFQRGFATPLLWPAGKPDQIIVPGTLRLVAYRVKDGVECWSVRGLPNEMVSSPVSGDGLIYIAGWTYGSGVSRMPAFDQLLGQADANKDGQLTRAEVPEGPVKRHFVYIDADKNGRVSGEEYAAIARVFDESKNVALAVRPGGRGDVTDTHVVWKATRGLPYVPSPLYYEDRIYLVKNGGLASCFDSHTGRVNYQEERLGALGEYYSSPVAAAGKVCVASQAGVVVIYRAGDALEVLARNPLDEPILATPAIVDGNLYVRTKSLLYAFGTGGKPVASADDNSETHTPRTPP